MLFCACCIYMVYMFDLWENDSSIHFQQSNILKLDRISYKEESVSAVKALGWLKFICWPWHYFCKNIVFFLFFFNKRTFISLLILGHTKALYGCNSLCNFIVLYIVRKVMISTFTKMPHFSNVHDWITAQVRST